MIKDKATISRLSSLHFQQVKNKEEPTTFLTQVYFFFKFPYNSCSGLGIGCIGLILTCVGLGDKGYCSPHLQLVGPFLLLIGTLFYKLFSMVD